MTVHILLIDSDKSLVNEVQSVLARKGYRVDQVAPGLGAIRQMLIDQPDLVILGIDLHQEDWQFYRRLQLFLEAPLLLLLSTDDGLDCVQGLKLGADDCMTKPVLVVELVARVQALLRRRMPADSRRQSLFVDGELIVDLDRREARLTGKPVALTPIEFRLLSCLVRHAGEVVPHERLLMQVWGPKRKDSPELLKPHIYHLRQKLEPDPSRPQRIVTRLRQGYMLQRIAE